MVPVDYKEAGQITDDEILKQVPESYTNPKWPGRHVAGIAPRPRVGTRSHSILRSFPVYSLPTSCTQVFVEANGRWKTLPMVILD